MLYLNSSGYSGSRLNHQQNELITDLCQSDSISLVALGIHSLLIKDKRDYTRLLYCPSRSDHIVLYISFSGRLANLFIQLTNCISIALAYGINKIYIDPRSLEHNFFESITNTIRLYDQHSISLIVGRPSSGLVISSRFFHVRRHSPHVFQDYSFVDHIKRLKPHLSIYNQSLLVSSSIQSSPKTLTIHIRSGDVFYADNVHQDYGQPPLSYYQLCIAHFQPKLVRLVYEDLSNPVITKLVELLHFSAIQTICHSVDLATDLGVLLASRNIVLSRGTFAIVPISLSDRLESIYTFNLCSEDDDYMKLPSLSYFYGRHLDKSPPTHFNIEDLSSAYTSQICNHNWTNSDYQRMLMLSYPKSSLSIRELLSPAHQDYN